MDWTEWAEHAALTDVGRHRQSNQDAFAAAPATDIELFRSHGHLFMVADGMGAHAAGELASKIACDIVPLTYHKYTKVDPSEAVRLAIQTANETVHRRGQMNNDFAGMGTTVSVLVVQGDSALIAHVGDSRVYRVRSNVVSQMTRDHSLAWELVARGRLRPDQVEAFGARNVIVRSVGPDEEVQVDVMGPFPVQPGDIFLLCSDGLSGPVSDIEIGLLAQGLAPRDACRALVNLANARGGPDNITVQIVRVREVGEPEDANQPEAVGVTRAEPGPMGVLRWVVRHWKRLDVALMALCTAYVAAAVALGWRVGIELAAALALVGAFGLVAAWYWRRSSDDEEEDLGPMPVQAHQDTPIVLDAERLKTLRASCQELQLQAEHLGADELAKTLESRLEQAAEHTRGERFDDAVAEYAAVLLTDGVGAPSAGQ